MWGKRLSAPRESSDARVTERFIARRRERRRRAITIASVLLFVLLAGALYIANQDFARVKNIVVLGTDAPLASIVQPILAGSYLGLLSRDSILFYPASEIRAAILGAYPDVAAVSLSREGLTGLSVKVDYRVPIAQWCGATPSSRFDFATSSNAGAVHEECYYFDSGGVLFSTTTEIAPVNTFFFYEPLAGDAPAHLGTTLPFEHTIPAAFDFARQLSGLGSPVVAVIYRDTEVDDILEHGTRVTYLRGSEVQAFAAIVAAGAGLDFASGSLDYIDLRFPGKVYLKKRSSTQ